jgi:hypothetical protein
VGQQNIFSAQENINRIFFVSNYASSQKETEEMLIVMQQ